MCARYPPNSPQIKQSQFISSKYLDHRAPDLLLGDSFNAVVKVSVPLCFINISICTVHSLLKPYMATAHGHILQLEAPGLDHIQRSHVQIEAITFAVTDLVYAGTVVKGVWITGVVHETGYITGSVRLFQELHFHIHLMQLYGDNSETEVRL